MSKITNSAMLLDIENFLKQQIAAHISTCPSRIKILSIGCIDQQWSEQVNEYGLPVDDDDEDEAVGYEQRATRKVEWRLNYFDGKRTGEIDFVIQNGMGTELVEVKFGNDYKTHSALNKIRNTEGWKFSKASVFCKGNVELENGVWYYPWYMILFAKPFRAPKEMKYEIDLSALK